MTTQKQINEQRAAALIEERRVYRAVFMGEAGRISGDGKSLLEYLAKFCYMKKSSPKVSQISGMIDPYATHIAEGRREVYLRIQEMLEMPDAAFNLMIEQLTKTEDEE